MTNPENIKPAARQLVENLPDSATWDHLAYEVYVRQSIETGLADNRGPVDGGRAAVSS
jgi:hypothetical protein